MQEWGAPEADLIATLGDRVRDPFVAQALMEAIPPERLHRIVERLLTHIGSMPRMGEWWKTQFLSLIHI